MKNLIFCVILAIMLTGCAAAPDSLTIKTKDVTIIKEAESLDFVADDIDIRAGASSASQIFILHNTPDITYDADTYVLLWDTQTGNFVDTAGADAGEVSTDVTWADASLATVAHTKNTTAYITIIPALDLSYQYAMTIWSGKNDSTADTLQAGPWLYDPLTNQTYTDTNPIKGAKVRVRND